MIEKILDIDFRNVSDLAEVYLAVRATDLLALRGQLTV
jgi:DNA-binding PucR family transcriptional regulator